MFSKLQKKRKSIKIHDGQRSLIWIFKSTNTKYSLKFIKQQDWFLCDWWVDWALRVKFLVQV